ncbi:Cytoplasmic tRNA 2-thiolation protein 2 [Batrachochytrium dendrobatidis]
MDETPKTKLSGRALKPGMCNKCKVETPSIIVKRAEFCRSCFLDSVGHRFRGNLSKSSIPEGSKLMVAFSGGPSSRALLQTMNDYCRVDSENNRKKRKFPEFCVCYVDQSSILDSHASDASKITAVVNSYQRELFIVSLEVVFEEHAPALLKTHIGVDDTISASSSFNIELEKNAKKVDSRLLVQQMFGTLSSMTSKEDLLHYLTLHTLVREAKAQGCAGILLGDTATSVAINVISNTCKGRGLSLPADIMDSEWYQDVHILRPMRDILSKEIGIFNRLSKLETVAHSSLTTFMAPKASISRLSQDFIVGLEKEFPATVSTVARTAFKIQTNHLSKKQCPLCEGPVDSTDNFASIDSSAETPGYPCKPICETKPSFECCSDDKTTTACCAQNVNKNEQVNVYPLLCYACRNIAHDFPKQKTTQSPSPNQHDVPLPAYIAHNSFRRLSQNELRNQISDFLIEDDNSVSY